MTSTMERRLLCEWEENRDEMIEKLKSDYSNVFNELNSKSVEYITFSICSDESWFRMWIRTNNSFNNYLIRGYDLIQLCNLIGIEFDIYKILDGYRFYKKFI